MNLKINIWTSKICYSNLKIVISILKIIFEFLNCYSNLKFEIWILQIVSCIKIYMFKSKIPIPIMIF
jgi:hypothetical protein